MKANLTTFQRKGGANLCQKCQKTEDEQKLPAKVHKLKLFILRRIMYIVNGKDTSDHLIHNPIPG